MEEKEFDESIDELIEDGLVTKGHDGVDITYSLTDLGIWLGDTGLYEIFCKGTNKDRKLLRKRFEERKQ